MTELLYDKEPYQKEFKATVKACEKSKDRFAVILDKTLFFPEQGGQSSDIGTINDATVLDVQIDEDIIHFTDKPLQVGDEIIASIDWAHRFNNMQNHTGEHIFTGLAHNKYKAENVGFHLSDNTVTLDLNIELTQSQIDEIEQEANRVIAENRPVKCWYPSTSELELVEYRSKKEIIGATRLVEISGIDICACCAPHVSTTSQVGILKVLSFNKYKGGTRIYILCGLRALADYKQKQGIIDASKPLLNCQEDQITTKIEALFEEIKNLKYELADIKKAQLMGQIATYPADSTDAIIFSSNLDTKTMRDGVNSLMENRSGLCAVFSGDDETGYNFVLGSTSRDCNAIGAGLRQMLLAKCGGSQQMIQGSVACSKSDIQRIL